MQAILDFSHRVNVLVLKWIPILGHDSKRLVSITMVIRQESVICSANKKIKNIQILGEVNLSQFM